MIWSDMVWNLSCMFCSSVCTCKGKRGLASRRRQRDDAPSSGARTHVLRQLLHVLRVGAVAHPVAVDVLALVVLLDVGHPRHTLRRGRNGRVEGWGLGNGYPPPSSRAARRRRRAPAIDPTTFDSTLPEARREVGRGKSGSRNRCGRSDWREFRSRAQAMIFQIPSVAPIGLEEMKKTIRRRGSMTRGRGRVTMRSEAGRCKLNVGKKEFKTRRKCFSRSRDLE